MSRGRVSPKDWMKMTAAQQQQIIRNRGTKKVIKRAGKKKARKNGAGRTGISEVQATLGSQMRTDVRSMASKASDLGLQNQLSTVTTQMNLEAASIVNLCQGYLSVALSRGFAAGSNTEQTPYYSLVFMCNLLLAYIQATAIPVTELPYWLLCLGHAISPKQVPFGNGSSSYSFNFLGTTPILPAVNTVIGYQPYGVTWTAGWSNDAITADGFPTVLVAPVAYNATLGAAAFSQLVQYMANTFSDPEMLRLNKLVASTSHTPLELDVSAFAVTRQHEGLGSSGLGGGFFFLLQLEVPNFRPLLGLFAAAPEPGGTQSIDRFFKWTTAAAGDPMMLGVVMPSLNTFGEYFAKRMTKLHCVDFLEFGDVLARWVQKITQSYATDVSQQQLNAAFVAAATCPLSLQEMLLLLRAVVMSAFKETQPAVQGLYPYTPQSPTDNQFVPFVSSANTCALFCPDMHLPIPIIENLRALMGRKVIHKGNDITWYMPVLGQYNSDVLSSADYNYEYVGSDSTTVQSAFVAGPYFKRKLRDSKGSTSSVLTVAPQISLIDGSYTSGFVQINDQAQLKVYAAMWNTWVENSGVATFSVQLGTFGTEPGITALMSTAMTRHWIEAPPQVGEKYEIDMRLEKPQFSAIVGTPYVDRWAIVDSSQGKIFAPIWEQVLGTWILPQIQVQETNDDQDTKLQRWQYAMDEPYSVTLSSGSNGVTLSSLHDTYASKCTKAKLGAPSDWNEFFAEQAKNGRGGILSSLVGGFIKSAFPAASSVVDTVSGILPI